MGISKKAALGYSLSAFGFWFIDFWLLAIGSLFRSFHPSALAFTALTDTSLTNMCVDHMHTLFSFLTVLNR